MTKKNKKNTKPAEENDDRDEALKDEASESEPLENDESGAAEDVDEADATVIDMSIPDMDELEPIDGAEVHDQPDLPEGPVEMEDEDTESPYDADIREMDDDDENEDEIEDPEALPLDIEEERADVQSVGEEDYPKTPGQVKGALECLLFTTPNPLSLLKMRNLMGKIDAKTLRGLIAQLQAEYEVRGSGLQILESAEGYQMCTRPQYADIILRLHRQRKKNPLSTTALETLAIVAYKQPATRAEVEMIRGVESSGVLRNLADLGMIKVVGRKEVIGRPQLYGTTSLFLTTFGLRNLDELPSIQTLRKRYDPNDKPLVLNLPDEDYEESEETGQEEAAGAMDDQESIEASDEEQIEDNTFQLPEDYFDRDADMDEDEDDYLEEDDASDEEDDAFEDQEDEDSDDDDFAADDYDDDDNEEDDDDVYGDDDDDDDDDDSDEQDKDEEE